MDHPLCFSSGKFLYSELFLYDNAIHVAVKFLHGSQGPPGLVHGAGIVTAFEDALESAGSSRIVRIEVKYSNFIRVEQTVHLQIALPGDGSSLRGQAEGPVLLTGSLGSEGSDGKPAKVYASANVWVVVDEKNFVLKRRKAIGRSYVFYYDERTGKPLGGPAAATTAYAPESAARECRHATQKWGSTSPLVQQLCRYEEEGELQQVHLDADGLLSKVLGHRLLDFRALCYFFWKQPERAADNHENGFRSTNQAAGGLITIGIFFAGSSSSDNKMTVHRGGIATMIDDSFTMAVELVKKTNGIPAELMFLTTVLKLQFDCNSVEVGSTIAVEVKTLSLGESESGGAYVLTMEATLLRTASGGASVSQLLADEGASVAALATAACCTGKCTMVARKKPLPAKQAKL
jgi:hypothetical protein